MSWLSWQLLKRKLNSSKEATRLQAVEEVAAAGSTDALALLVQTALADDAEPVRKAAGQALHKLNDARAVKPLLSALANPELREAAVDALVVLPDLAVTPLLDGYGDAEADGRRGIIEALSRIGEPAVEKLLDAQKNGNWITRQAATEALKSMGGKSPDATQPEPTPAATVPPTPTPASSTDLLAEAAKLLMNPDPDERKEAVCALHQIPAPQATKLLVGALEDASPVVRKGAVLALDARSWEPPDAVKRALRATAHGAFADAVAEGVVAVRPIVAVLPTVDPQERRSALTALHQIITEHAADIEPQDLRAVAELPELRELAQEELQRRGMKG
jgi:HEAT repeat protein